MWVYVCTTPFLLYYLGSEISYCDTPRTLFLFRMVLTAWPFVFPCEFSYLSISMMNKVFNGNHILLSHCSDKIPWPRPRKKKEFIEGLQFQRMSPCPSPVRKVDSRQAGMVLEQ